MDTDRSQIIITMPRLNVVSKFKGTETERWAMVDAILHAKGN